jgi:hypothetical protein
MIRVSVMAQPDAVQGSVTLHIPFMGAARLVVVYHDADAGLPA